MILLVGATGFLGRELSRQLLADGQAVRAMTRYPEKAGFLRSAGAEVVAGDLTDPDSLARACAGADVVIAAAHSLLGRGRYTSASVDDRGNRRLIDAAKAAGVRHMVFMSVQGAAAGHPVPFWRTKFAVEEYLRASGLRYTILRPTAFMEVHAHEFLGKSILEKGKTMILGKGDQPANFVAVRDVARVVVEALRNPALHDQTVDIGGPDNLSRREVAALYGRLSGRSPKVNHLPPAALRLLSTIARPLHPGVSNLLGLSAYFDKVDQSFEPGPAAYSFSPPAMSLEDFVREQIRVGVVGVEG